MGIFHKDKGLYYISSCSVLQHGKFTSFHISYITFSQTSICLQNTETAVNLPNWMENNKNFILSKNHLYNLAAFNISHSQCSDWILSGFRTYVTDYLLLHTHKLFLI